MQLSLHHESITDALREVIQAQPAAPRLSGPKCSPTRPLTMPPAVSATA